jgi:hypothetical protein
MSQVDYTAMSYKELRRYFLKHREDKAAFQAYLARRRERSAEGSSARLTPRFANAIASSHYKS